MPLEPHNLVVKSNNLNQMKKTQTSLVEYKLFLIAVSKLDSRDKELKPVQFSLKEYTALMGLNKPRKNLLLKQAENITSKTINIQRPDGGFSTLNIFSEFSLERGKIHGKYDWVVTIHFNNNLKSHLVEQKREFITYKLYNSLFLGSLNQIRLYEILKQWQLVGEKIIELNELKEFLSINKESYKLWGDFSEKVLKVAQKSIRENTDIDFDFEPIKNMRRVVAVKFFIKKNPHTQDIINKIKKIIDEPSTLLEGDKSDLFFYNKENVAFNIKREISENLPEPDIITPKDCGIIDVQYNKDYQAEIIELYKEENLKFFVEAVDYEFGKNLIKEVIELCIPNVPVEFTYDVGYTCAIYDYINEKYNKMNNKQGIKNRFNYFKTLLENNY